MRFGQSRRQYRQRFVADWIEEAASGIGVALFVMVVLGVCGYYPKDLQQYLHGLHAALIRLNKAN